MLELVLRTGRDFGIAIIMAVFLTISLSIAAFMNWYNARMALVVR